MKNEARTRIGRVNTLSVHAEQKAIADILKKYGHYDLLPLLSVKTDFNKIPKRLKDKLQKVKRIFKKITIIVYRETSDGCLACAKPCTVCKNIMLNFGVKKVIYSTPDGMVRSKVTELETLLTRNMRNGDWKKKMR
jgi:cytidine deaminase